MSENKSIDGERKVSLHIPKEYYMMTTHHISTRSCHTTLREINTSSLASRQQQVKKEMPATKETKDSMSAFISHHPHVPMKRSSSSSLSPQKQTAKYQRIKLENNSVSEKHSSDSEEVLDYEKIREKNLRDNEAFLVSLGIQKARDALKSLSKNSMKTTLHKPHREFKPKEVLPRRQSLRIRRINPLGVPLPPVPEPEPVVEEHLHLPDGPLQMTTVFDLIDDGGIGHTSLVNLITNIDKESCSYYPHRSTLSSFIKEFGRLHARKVKLCKDRLFSVTLHPSTDKVLAIAGDKWGQVGFWNVNSNDEGNSVVVYRPHSRPVCHIHVPHWEPQKVYSCSYDSTLRCGHFDTGIFEEVYSVPEEHDDLFRSFDFLSPNTLLVAQMMGSVALVDTRTSHNKADSLYHVCDKHLRVVSVHPLDKNFFLTAGTDLKACIWDIRNMKAKGSKPIHTIQTYRSASSAYFSPLTGSHILTCVSDNTLNIYNCTSSCGEVTLSKKISHDNQTGRWLTPFRAVWHPAREDMFFVGCMKKPRRIEAFGADGHLVHEFLNEEVLTSICSLVHFHQSRPALVGGNSSGYLFAFM